MSAAATAIQKRPDVWRQVALLLVLRTENAVGCKQRNGWQRNRRSNTNDYSTCGQ